MQSLVVDMTLGIVAQRSISVETFSEALSSFHVGLYTLRPAATVTIKWSPCNPRIALLFYAHVLLLGVKKAPTRFSRTNIFLSNGKSGVFDYGEFKDSLPENFPQRPITRNCNITAETGNTFISWSDTLLRNSNDKHRVFDCVEFKESNITYSFY